MAHDIDSLVGRFTREQGERVASALQAGRPLEAHGPRLLNAPLAGGLRAVGHTQMVVIADKGFPMPPGVETLDLALSDDIPTVLDVLRAIADEFSFDRVLIAEEMRTVSAKRAEELARLAAKPIEAFPHVEFKHIAAHARLAVRTGDTTPYGNCILVCG